jgi:hypothetical protein
VRRCSKIRGAKWRIETRRDLSGVHGDALLYREYTLALIWPRSCPEYLDDDVVSFWLNKCARENRLPWELDIPEDWT